MDLIDMDNYANSSSDASHIHFSNQLYDYKDWSFINIYNHLISVK